MHLGAAGHRVGVEHRPVGGRGGHVEVAVRQGQDRLAGDEGGEAVQPGLRHLGDGLLVVGELLSAGAGGPSGAPPRSDGQGASAASPRRLPAGSSSASSAASLLRRVGGEAAARVAGRQPGDGGQHGRVDQPADRRAAGRLPGVEHRVEAPAVAEGRAPAAYAGHPAVGGVADLVADGDDDRRVDGPVRRRDVRDEGAGPAVGERVARHRGVPDRVDADPVGAGLDDAEQLAGHLEREAGGLPGLEQVDGVVGPRLDDPVADVLGGVDGRGRRQRGRVDDRGGGPEGVEVDAGPRLGALVGDRAGDRAPAGRRR